MYDPNGTMGLIPPLLATIILVSSSVGLDGQRGEPVAVATVDGDSMVQVIPAGEIPAITEPSFLSGKEAAAQMSEEEPVMGLVLEGEARAYSLWQLDAHEIVNDEIGGTPFAVTW